MKSSETGPTVYRPYMRRLESPTICRCKAALSTRLFKTMSVDPAMIRNQDLPLGGLTLKQLCLQSNLALKLRANKFTQW